jgi:hypothetical protein
MLSDQSHAAATATCMPRPSMNQHHALALCLTLLLAPPPSAGAQQPGADTTAGPKIQQAETAAARWLALVDSSRYGASWDSAATMFRSQITKPAWQDAVVAARSQVDPLRARRLSSSQYTRQLPQAPPGEYVVLQYSTTARENRRVTEAVVLTLDASETWRVAGYFVRPG